MKFAWSCQDLESNCLESEETVLIGVNEQFCKRCESGYRLKDKKCVKCAIDNCGDCDADENACASCSTGFFKEVTGEGEDAVTKCTACKDKCLQCESLDVCLDCEIGYAFSSDLSTCESCGKIANCEKCWSMDICVMCKEGNYLAADKKSCVACNKECRTCYDGTYCQECNEGYFFKEAYVCSKCIDNCGICDNEFTCTTCNENYLVSSDKKYCMFKDACKTENVNCKTCNEVTTKCYACNEEYFLETTLSRCLANCLKCENTSECQECKTGYELN